MNWRPFSSVEQAIFSLLGVKPEGKKYTEEEEVHVVEEEEEEQANLMVSTISFIQANLQHSIAASRILTRTVSDKGTHGTDTGTVVSQELHQGPEYSGIYPVLCWRNRQTQGVHPCREHDQLDAAWILL
jgi:hypothetical protein